MLDNHMVAMNVLPTEGMKETTGSRKKVYEILKDFSTAMLVTICPDGGPGARPMHIARVDEGSGNVWFLTSKGGNLAKELKANGSVLLVFEKENAVYLSLKGDARVTEDRKMIQDLWKEPYKVWFPKGVEDPDIAAIGVSATAAEYWDNQGVNKLQYLFETAKAYVKGERAHVDDADQHAKTTL